MSYTKQNFTDGQVLKAEHLNHIEQGIEKAGKVADWNQNDPNAPDYVANRTHYVEEVEEVLVDETVTEFTNEDGFCIGEYYSGLDLTHGETYTVIFNGVQYALVYDDDAGCMGNLNIVGMGDDTGEQFCLNGWEVYTKTSESCTIKIIRVKESVTPFFS